MVCPKCRVGMKEMKRTHHKKRKWVCPVCGRTRMQGTETRAKDEAKKYG